MALLLVLFILVLGYQYAAHIPAEQIKFMMACCDC